MSERENILDKAESISLANAYNNYYSFLQQHGLDSYPIFNNPKLFFYVLNDSLRCPGTNIRIDIEEGIPQKTAARFNEEYFPDRPLEEDVIKTLVKNLYTYLSQIELSSYEKALLDFKWNCHLHYLPYFENFENISVANNKIYIHQINEYGQRYSLLLTDSLMENIVTDNGGHYVASDNSKTKLAKELIALYGYSAPEAPDIYSVKFSEGLLTYLPSMESVKFNQNITKDHSYKPYIKSGYTPEAFNQKPSDNVYKFLKDVTESSVYKLEMISELVARLMVKNLPSKYIWDLAGLGKNKFAKLLSLLCEAKTASSIYDKKGKYLYKALINDKANGSMLQANVMMVSKKQLCETNHSTINKLIRGAEIKEISDPFILNSEVYTPLVVLIQYGLDYDDFFKKFSSCTIHLGEFDLTELNDSDLCWLRLYLSAYGLYLIHKADEDEEVLTEDLIKNFINDFCIKAEPELSDKSGKKKPRYTTAKDFTEALNRYAEALGKGSLKLLSNPTLLAKKVEASGLTKKVLKAAGNTNCFMDTLISEDKLSEFIEKKNQEDSSQNKFDNAINFISSLIQFEGYSF